jgi:hypothetical protein
MSKENFDYAEFYKKFYEGWEKTMSEAIEMWTKSPLLNKHEANEKADPMSHYKRFYETWEKTTSEALEMWLKSPLFAANMGKAIEKSSEFKKYLDEIIEKSLKNMRMPTKSDIDRVLLSINNIEAKINDLTDKVDELRPSKQASKK